MPNHPFNISKARKNLSERLRKKENVLQKRFEQAQKDFHSACTMITEKYRPRRIYQWGSLLNWKHFSEISDIDIGIEGNFNAETFFAMLKDIESITQFPVDLVDLNKINPLNAQTIRTKGKLIYDAKDRVA